MRNLDGMLFKALPKWCATRPAVARKGATPRREFQRTEAENNSRSICAEKRNGCFRVMPRSITVAWANVNIQLPGTVPNLSNSMPLISCKQDIRDAQVLVCSCIRVAAKVCEM